jgi:hypothetical protein
MNSAKNLVLATFATAISVAVMDIAPTQAAIINYNFTVDVTSGDNPGQYFGSFRYDDSTLTNIDSETIGVENGLALKFNYLGTTYTEKDDIDYDSFPIVSFNNGTLLGLSYFVADKFAIAADANNLDLGGDKFFTVRNSVNTTQVGTVKYTQVPEPVTIGGTAIATLMGLWLKQKKKAAKVAAS